MTIWNAQNPGLYTPQCPYVFKSGKNRGKCLELMMFSGEYGFLNWLLKKLEKKSNGGQNLLHKHLEWLLQRGENRKTHRICLFCGEKNVELFSMRDSGGDNSFDVEYTCCNNDLCKESLRAQAFGKLVIFKPIKFSSMLNFNLKCDRKMLGNMFKQIFVLPNRLTRNHTFAFFNE